MRNKLRSLRLQATAKSGHAVEQAVMVCLIIKKPIRATVALGTPHPQAQDDRSFVGKNAWSRNANAVAATSGVIQRDLRAMMSPLAEQRWGRTPSLAPDIHAGTTPPHQKQVVSVSVN
jgi:hypothetical protein